MWLRKCTRIQMMMMMKKIFLLLIIRKWIKDSRELIRVILVGRITCQATIITLELIINCTNNNKCSHNLIHNINNNYILNNKIINNSINKIRLDILLNNNNFHNKVICRMLIELIHFKIKIKARINNKWTKQTQCSIKDNKIICNRIYNSKIQKIHLSNNNNKIMVSIVNNLDKTSISNLFQTNLQIKIIRRVPNFHQLLNQLNNKCISNKILIFNQ